MIHPPTTATTKFFKFFDTGVLCLHRNEFARTGTGPGHARCRDDAGA